MNISRTPQAILLAVLALLLFTPGPAAQTVNSDVGTTAFPFLKIQMGARPVAMGGAFTGLASDETALYYNPAGIAGFEQKRFITGYHSYFVDLQSGVIGYIHPINLDNTIAFHMTYLTMGDFIETDLDGNELGTFGGSDLMIAVTYATRRNLNWRFGATAKLIMEKIHDYSASGMAVDLGVKYTSGRDRYSAGLMVQNLGTQLSTFTDGEKDGLPTTIRTGGAARPRGLPIQFTGDLVFPFDNDLDFALGMEYYESQPLYLRVGWNSFGSNYRAGDSDESLAGFSFGFGLDVKKMQVSYAFSPAADLGESHRITLTGGF